MTESRFNRISCVVLALAAGFSTGAAEAQNSGKRISMPPAVVQPPKGTAPAPSSAPADLFSQGTVEFADEPLRLDSVGLMMQVPVNSQLKASRGAGVQNLSVVAPDQSWLVNVRTPQTNDAATTIAEAVDKTVKLLQYSVGVTDPSGDRVVETEAEILERNDALTINGQPAARVYVSIPGSQPNKRIVKGYTFFKPTAKQFVVFELIVPNDAFTRVRSVYETSIATAKFADPGLMAAAYGAAVKAGVRLFEQVDEADIIAAMGTGEQLHRLYRPATSGSPNDAQELGYRSMKFWAGKRGEVDADSRKSSWKGADLQDGYLCQMTVRLVDGTSMVDTVARYFMTPSRTEEAWTVVLVKTDAKGREAGRWQETGARTGSEVRVLVVEPGQTNRPIEPFIQGEGYISQFESYLLPSLLMHKAVVDKLEAEFGFYSYRSESEAISLRRDTVSRDTQSGGAWTISTRFRDDAKPQRSVFNERGELIRTELPDGRIWEPIKLDALTRLWQTKGLPTKR